MRCPTLGRFSVTCSYFIAAASVTVIVVIVIAAVIVVIIALEIENRI